MVTLLKLWVPLFLAFFAFGVSGEGLPPIPAVLDASKPITKIAFGSCNEHLRPQTYWDSISKFDPQLWIWLGDVVYADIRVAPFIWRPAKPEEMKEKFQHLKMNPHYAKFVEKVPVVGVFDDHDFGKNDGGAEYEHKAAGKEIFLDFLDEPMETVRRKQRSGVHVSYAIGPTGQKAKIILLDVRSNKVGTYGQGDILGEDQWQWLELELANSDAQLHIIGSGIQVLPTTKIVQEKWGSFPSSRARLLSLIAKTQARGVVFLSGDVHYAELMRLPAACSPNGLDIWEATSSGLTHTCDGNVAGLCHAILNKIMEHDFFTQKNWGSIFIDWTKKSVTLQIHNLNGTVVLKQEVSFAGQPKHTNPSANAECMPYEKQSQFIHNIPFDHLRWVIWALALIILYAIVSVSRAFFRCLCRPNVKKAPVKVKKN